MHCSTEVLQCCSVANLDSDSHFRRVQLKLVLLQNAEIKFCKKSAIALGTTCIFSADMKWIDQPDNYTISVYRTVIDLTYQKLFT